MKSKILIISLICCALLNLTSLNIFATTESSNEKYNGIDVSNWQGKINFEELKNEGIDIVYIKSSQGNNIIDSYFKINYNNAKENNFKIGFYHYLTARDEQEAIEQADFFTSVISNTNPDCKLAMDFENFGDLNINEINNISKIFLERVKENTGKEVIIYSDAYNAKNVFGIELYNEYPLWIAEYGVEVPARSNWEFWEGFQYSDEGRLSGIQGFVDMDIFTEDIFLGETKEIEPNGDPINYNRDTIYVVKRGNILSRIAYNFGTTVKELAQINNIKNPNLIYPGERLIVPIKGNINNENLYDTNHIIYVVKLGDTLSQIALKFNTTVSSIARNNNIKNVNLIYVGQRLRIDK